jgi:hypothetical protein
MQMKLNQYLELIDYNLEGTAEYMWKSFGPNARYFDCLKRGKYEITAIADTKTKQIYYAAVVDSKNARQYLWIDPDYKDEYIHESESRNCNYAQAYDDVEYTVLDVESDWLEKARAIFLGEPYDERVVVPIDLPDDLLFESMKRAHELDITFNEYVARAIHAVIDEQAQTSS